ncbi:hypothetical protein ACFL35_18215 [Candidatus Riflebacteria bacterium]
MKIEKKIPVGRYLIYGLIDPTNRCLRYIGKTHQRREWRLAEHLEKAKNGVDSHVYNWIRQLINKGLEPEIFVIEKVPPEKDWREAEIRNIAFWRNPIEIDFPYVHPPQTPKSKPTLIKSVSLTNVAEGG